MGTVLRQSLGERVRPCLFAGKVGRRILELHMESQDMYGRFRKAIEDENGIIVTYNDDPTDDVQVTLERGTVVFGSGLHDGGLNAERLVRIHAAKKGVGKEKMMK